MTKRFFRLCISIFVRAGIKILLYLIKSLPASIAYLLAGDLLSRLFYMVSRRNRNLARRNLKLAFGPTLNSSQIESIARASFKTMGQTVIDTLRYKDLTKDKIKDLIEIDGLENLKQALANKKGVIVVSAHMGTFTTIGYRLMIEGVKTSFIVRHLRDRSLEHVFMKICLQVGQKIIFNRPILTCMRLSMKTLARNEVLIIEVDQNFGVEGVTVNFFNRSAKMASGPVMLSQHSGAPILPVFLINREDHTHVIKIEPPLELISSGDEDKDMRVNSQKIIEVVEKYIRKYPGQWLNWIHKQWENV
ncbi:MAG: lysophospholipid acyltransferase family protein, partial [Candidatus Omnitrophota bacterium]